MVDKPLVSFDYAIKYLLKDKGDFNIIEGFISALLKTRGYKDIKIIALLDSESNKENGKSKRSLADLIVEDEDHRKYIIEIERSVKDSFIHKSLFNTSRLIVDNLAQREDYTDIIKVFHISLLYFAIGQNKGAIYHGKTIIHEIDSQERLSVHIKNTDTGQTFDATDIMPEYFFISIPLFNDQLEREIDDWLHVMKYDEVPTSYHSSYMIQVAEKLSILKMTAEERANYSYYRKKLHNDRDELLAAEARGEAKGEQKLKEEQQKNLKEKQLIAHKLRQQGMSAQDVAELMGLSVEQVQQSMEL